ncbi:hypothetical protein KY084_10895 [Stakelama sp. CBK3Z-3]|uniref:XRE family transcriptional regulator n=1 Tax=Stakelama flava TaxID=2860338 RepID=A0ABS6XNP9_9SPHN|nr:hypothetical protein [Stakelama flava]MBW4331378.1 hypothetical protein [Stakelama flava]
MSRRKGERPVALELDRYGEDHPVAQMIADGDNWFQAWTAQTATPLTTLAKRTGIPRTRLLTIERDDRISRAELDALARAWCVSAGDLESSIDKRVQIIP